MTDSALEYFVVLYTAVLWIVFNKAYLKYWEKETRKEDEHAG